MKKAIIAFLFIISFPALSFTNDQKIRLCKIEDAEFFAKLSLILELKAEKKYSPSDVISFFQEGYVGYAFNNGFSFVSTIRPIMESNANTVEEAVVVAENYCLSRLNKKFK